MLAAADGKGQLRQPSAQAIHDDGFERAQVERHSACVVPLAQFRGELQQPGQTVRALKTLPSWRTYIFSLLCEVLCRKTLVECGAGTWGEPRVGEQPSYAREKPMSVHCRMPVITAVESGRELAGRRNIGIAAQGVSDFIGIFLMN